VEMSSTPDKSSKIGNRKEDCNCNNLYRFCGIESGQKRRASFEILFTKCLETVLADCFCSLKTLVNTFSGPRLLLVVFDAIVQLTINKLLSEY